MKVVLFCDGPRTGIREFSEGMPRCMDTIGYQPVLWHLMKYYAHYGHRDFVLCLGHKGEVIKDYFVKREIYISHDFVLSGGYVNGLRRDSDEWNITFVDTGTASNTAQRLLAIKKYVEQEDFFLANYSDALTDVYLPDLIEKFKRQNKVAQIMVAKSSGNVHFATMDDDYKTVTRIHSLGHSKHLWVNAGFFVFSNRIFDFVDPTGELTEKTFPILSRTKQLAAYPHRGVFLSMDSFHERELLEKMYDSGHAPWQVWNHDLQVEQSRVML